MNTVPTPNFIERFRALPTAQKQRRIGLTLLLLFVATMFYACSERLGGGSVYVYDAATRQPVAGVPVVLYIRSNAANLLPFMHSGGGGGAHCDSDFYGVTDRDGLIEVPHFSLFVWWEPSLNARSPIFRSEAYLRGHYAERTKLEGVAGAGHNARKSGPLRVEFAMVKDKEAPEQRAEYLVYMSRAGCRCSPIQAELSSELDAVALRIDHEERTANGGKRVKLPRNHTLNTACP